MFEPNKTIDLVKEVPVVDIISHYTDIKKNGGTYLGLCPFHDERTPSFHVHPARNFYKCFGCGAGGDGIQFVMKHKGKTFLEAIEAIAGIAKISECKSSAELGQNIG